jgi:hypothetical protein
LIFTCHSLVCEQVHEDSWYGTRPHALVVCSRTPEGRAATSAVPAAVSNSLITIGVIVLLLRKILSNDVEMQVGQSYSWMVYFLTHFLDDACVFLRLQPEATSQDKVCKLSCLFSCLNSACEFNCMKIMQMLM